MSSWTLRPQRTRDLRRGEKQEHTAVLRASRYVRRHAWQFHGAGVADAVQQLTGLREFGDASNAMKDTMVQFAENISVALSASVERASEPYGYCPDCKGPKLAPGLIHQCPVDPVLGWKSPSGLLLCLAHPHREATPVTVENLSEGGVCAVCRTELTP